MKSVHEVVKGGGTARWFARLLTLLVLCALGVAGIGVGAGTPVAAQGGGGNVIRAQQGTVRPQRVHLRYSASPPLGLLRGNPDERKINPVIPAGTPSRKAPPATPGIRIGKPKPPARQGFGAQSDSSPIGIVRNVALSAAATNGAASRNLTSSVASAGNVVFYTGRSFAAISGDGGQTFQYVDPATQFDADFGGFNGYQSVHYAPSINRFFWALEYNRDGSGHNMIRLALASPEDAVAGNWLFYPFLSSAENSGNWFDRPNLTLGANSLYLTANIYNNDATPVWQRSFLYRFSLAELAAAGTLNYTYFNFPQYFSLRAADYAGTRAVFAAHNSTSQLGIVRWDEGSGTAFFFTVNLTRTWNNTDYSSLTANGYNWLGRADSRILGATISGDHAWFAWTAGRGGGGSFADPYIEIAKIDINTLALLDQTQFFGVGFAIAYPALATNSVGEVGVSMALGGNGADPFHAVAYLTGTRNFAFTVFGTHGPSNDQWGDSLAIRRHSPQDWLFSTSPWSLQGGEGDANVEPRYVLFGRADEIGDAYEVDDTAPEAKTIDVNSTQNRSIHVTSDADYAKFTLTQPTDVAIYTGGRVFADTQLWLYDASGTEVEYDDDDGPGNYSRIVRSALPAGEYTIRVDEYNNNAVIPAYTLSVSTREHFVDLEYVVVNEDAGTATVTVQRTGDPNVATSVDYYTEDDSAQAGSDYTALPLTTLNFDVGETSKNIVIPISSDDRLEGLEQFFLRLTAPSQGTVGAAGGTTVYLIDDPAIPTPTNVQAIVLNASTLRVVWTDHCSNETQFAVERSADGGATWGAPEFAPAASGVGGIRSLTRAGIANGYYRYRVRAVNSFNESFSTDSNEVHLAPPTAPTPFTVTILSGTSTRLDWTNTSDNETGFRIYRWDPVTNVYSLIDTRAANSTSFTNSGLVSGRRYIYYVQAYNSAGAAVTPKVSVNMPLAPAAPGGFTVTILSSTSTRLNWTDPNSGLAQETGYRIYRWDPVTNVYALIHTTAANAVTYTNTGLVSGRRYIYYVQAFNLAGVANTAKISVTMP